MVLIFLAAVIILPTILFLFIGGKVRDKFIFEKAINEEIIEVNDATKFLRRNNETQYTEGVLYLTNKRFVFFKYRFGWLGIIPFIGEAFISIFIDKNAVVELPLHQIKNYTFKGTIIYRGNRASDQKAITTFYTKQHEEFEFDIYTLLLAENKRPDILDKLDKVLQTLDNPSMHNPN